MPPTTMMFTRRRMESVRSTSSITPADELTSWLPDDVCVTCHAQVKAGQLYCSQECREEDAKASAAESVKASNASSRPSNTATTTPSSTSSSSQFSSNMKRLDNGVTNDVTSSSEPLSTSHQNKESRPSRIPSGDAISSAAHNHNRTGSFVNSQQQQDDKFRYPCPPSPNILAKYGSHLTSPALAALDRKSSSHLQQTVTSEREFLSSSSEEDSTNGTNVQQKKSQRRSSSRSTFSSASETAFSTDPSTPSPAVRSTMVDDDDDLEPTDLNLPPSVHPVSTVMANIRDRRSPAQKKVNLPSNPPIVKRERVTMMSFARRPSRTNLPAPVLFTSPVLATTVMKASPQLKDGSNLHHHYQSGTTPPSSRRLSRRSSDRENGPSSMDKIDERTMKRISPTMMMKRGSVNAMPVNKQGNNTQSMRKSPSSPPQIASASSSAGKTLRAISPISNIAPASFAPSLHSNTPENGFVCGRYGCKGLSTSIEGQSPKSNGDEIKGNDETPVRRSMLLGHKHTHSASAGLSLMGQAVAEDRTSLNVNPAQLQMTTLSKEASAEEDEDEILMSIKSPPRGRSKARGRSSTSRRSPSPPRGAARRGRSEDMLSSKVFLPLASQPLKVTGLNANDGALSHDADDEQEDRRGRRGRSPTERGRMFTPKAVGLKSLDVNLGRMRIEEANEKAKQAPSPLDTPGSVSEVSVSDSTGYDEVDMDEL